MDSAPATHDTFVLVHAYPQPPERVFAAFADAAKKRRWFADGEHHECEGFEMEFRVGGFERTRQRFKAGTPFQGIALTSEGVFLDIVPNRRVVSASWMAFGDQRISASLVTIELVPHEGGTRLLCTHQSAYFEGADGARIREAGWKKLFGRLATELARA